MIDLKVTSIVDILPVTGIDWLPNTEVPTLVIEGSDFNHVNEVFINGMKSPDVVVVSNRKLLAQLPDTQTEEPIRSVIVSSNSLTLTDRSELRFEITDSPDSVSGITRLIQQFVKIMLQSPGSDIFAPRIGGGLLRSIGKQLGGPTKDLLVADFKKAVDEARRQMILLQASDHSLPAEERLLYATIAQMSFDTGSLSFSGKVALGNQTGQNYLVGLGL